MSKTLGWPVGVTRIVAPSKDQNGWMLMIFSVASSNESVSRSRESRGTSCRLR